MTNDQPEAPLEERLQALIQQLDAYIAHFHGGTVEMVSFQDNVSRVRLGGACLGCPLSQNTLHGWVEGTVRQFFPEIERVEAELHPDFNAPQ
jgi:Fe-S cluster biogenesis protein NfuA